MNPLRNPENAAAISGRVTACCHYWLVSSPNGPRALAVCRKCGAETDFPASYDPTDGPCRAGPIHPPAVVVPPAPPVARAARGARKGRKAGPVIYRLHRGQLVGVTTGGKA